MISYEGDAIPEKYREKEPRRVYAENELLEVSQVVIGSNRGALQMGVDNPNYEQCQYALEVIKSFGNEIPDWEKPTEKVVVKPKAAEPVVIPEPSVKEKISTESIIISPVEINNIKELQGVLDIYKSGRIISEKNRTVIKMAVEQLQKSVEVLNGLIELTEPKLDGGDDGNKSFKKEVEEFISRNKKIS